MNNTNNEEQKKQMQDLIEEPEHRCGICGAVCGCSGYCSLHDDEHAFTKGIYRNGE